MVVQVQVPTDGRLTSLTELTGTLDPTSFLYIVSPGSVSLGNSYKVALSTLYGSIAPSAANVSFTPSPPLSSTNVQAAITEVAADYAQIANLAAVAFSGAPVDLITNLVAWTPALTFATPGDLAVSYAAQFGRYTKLSSNLALVQFTIVTSAFTFSTSSGNFQITGLPLVSQNVASFIARGSMSFGGINKAGYTQVNLNLPINSSAFLIAASGMGVTSAPVVAADVPSGGAIVLVGEIVIFIQ